MTRRSLATLSVLTTTVASGLTAAPADASCGIFDNCTNFNEKLPHGASRKNAVDHTSGTPMTTFLHSNKKY